MPGPWRASVTAERQVAPVLATLVAGQSNALGTAPVTNVTVRSGLATPYPATRLIQRISAGELPTWVYLDGDLAPRDDGDFGVELSMARDSGLANVIKVAVGSTSITRWLDDLYAPLVETAGAYGALANIVWIQGETDAGSSALANAYGSRLVQLAANLDADIGYGTFVVVQLHSGCTQTHTSTVRSQQASAIASIPRGVLVDPSAYTLKADGVHYNADGLVQLGERLALELT